MNEITRIHIAKTAYDIEVAAKKELEKYIKSVEAYTQDSEVLTDVEIRITELLAEQGVKPGGVISSHDVEAVRKQLGEPYQFADDEGDMAIGPEFTPSGRRLYRSTDDAVLGGVLSGIAAFFGVNPLWTRLIFVLLLFISFGFAFLVYILLWVVIPPARTATEKLQLAGKGVNLESIKELNADEEAAQPNKVAPVLQRVFGATLGIASLLAAVTVFIVTAWLIIAAATYNSQFVEMTNGFTGLGDGNAWIAWSLFGVVIFGLLLLTALLGIIAYAFLAKKLTKAMVVIGVIIMVLGIASFATVVGVSTSQSWRVANESRSMERETKANLPKEFANVKSVSFSMTEEKDDDERDYFGSYGTIRYVVDEGPARYELTGLPSTKPIITQEGSEATISLSVPPSFRNSFVQPILTVYGPALDTISTSMAQVDYSGLTQDDLTIISEEGASISISGTYKTVIVEGSGTVDLGSSSIESLEVNAEQNLTVSAGTVRSLSISQPDVCPSGTYQQSTSVSVNGVTSDTVTYNGTKMSASSHQTGCASVNIESHSIYQD